MQAGLNRPRYASLKGIMQAKRKEIAALTPADLGLEASQVGLEGSGLEVVSVSFPDASGGALMIEGEPDECARQLVDRLQKEARVL